jgi:Cof subfamily protein (haloacid dehalogenase superfamily)
LPYRLIALDLDGTLLNSRKEISDRNRTVLAAVRERGVLPVVATGRTPHSALAFASQIGNGPVICCNGAAIMDAAGSYLELREIPTAPLLHLLDLGRRHRILMHCYSADGMVLDQPLAHALNYYQWIRSRTTPVRALTTVARMWGANRSRWVARLERWAGSPGRSPALKFMYFGPAAKLRPLAAQIRREVPQVEVTSSESDNLEVTAAGVSKASALAALGERLQIPPEAMVGFGDSDNDLEMLGFVGLGVAMGNASDHVKAAADRVAPTCDEDGVALVVEEVFGV